MSRKCPYCGEYVPSNSLNCPKCYKSIPRDEYKVKEDIRTGPIPNDRAPSVKVLNIRTVKLLALVPAAIGLMGLGQIYEREYSKGVKFLIAGIVLFASIVALITNFDSFGGGRFLAVALAIFLFILFIVTYVIQAFDAIVRSLIPVSMKF